MKKVKAKKAVVETPDTPLKVGALYLYYLGAAIVEDIRHGGLRIRAAALTYLTLLSFAPLLAISFSVLKGFGIHNQLEPMLLDFLAPLGPQGRDVASKIVEFVDHIKVGVLGAVGVVMLIYGVIGMMREIEAAFNDIWHVRQTRSLMQRMRDYLGILFIGPLFMSLSVLVTEAFRHTMLIQAWLGISLPDGAFDGLANLIPYGLFTFAFTAIYMFMPNTTVRFWPALIAGGVTSVLWKLLGWLFGLFVAGSASYAAIYSVFAVIMLLMIWIYNGWLVMLIGASMAYYIQNPSNRLMARSTHAMSWRVREKIALMLCGEVGRAFYKNEPAPMAYEIARRLRMPAQVAAEVAETLQKACILAAVGKSGRQLIPACPFDTVTAADMLTRLMLAEEEEGLRYEELSAQKAVDAMLDAAFAAARCEFGKTTLKELSA